MPVNYENSKLLLFRIAINVRVEVPFLQVRIGRVSIRGRNFAALDAGVGREDYVESSLALTRGLT